jgi:transposase
VLKIGELFMLHQLREEGLTISEIARRCGVDRKTVRKYLERSIAVPCYGPRLPRPQQLDPYRSYLQERVKAHPRLRATRLLREIQALGYPGSYTRLTDYLREIRPPRQNGFEHRFETAPGVQGQVDFAQFKTVFTDEPDHLRVVWLFSLVLGFSRYLFGQFVTGQHLAVVLRCHLDAFAELGGIPQQILYDRMKTAVLGEDEERQVIYHPKLIELAAHYGFRPRACAAYRAKTKGKVERPFRYVREDFFLAREFRNLDDLNVQFTQWRRDVANARCHGTTQRIVAEAFAEEHAALQAVPEMPFNAVLSMERRISRDGMVSINGNAYSVPDTTTRRVVEVHTLAHEIRIFEDRRLLAVHPVLAGSGGRRLAPGHRRWPPPGTQPTAAHPGSVCLTRPGDQVTRRCLSEYAAIGQAMAHGVDI